MRAPPLFVCCLLLLTACADRAPAPQPHAPALQVETGDPNLRKIRGLLYNGDILFTGILVETYENGRTRSRTEYVQGKRHGTEEKWYASGTRESLRTYRIGRKHGQHTGWWENGALRFRYNFQNGLSHGIQKEWYPTGQPFLETRYEYGREKGLQQGWKTTGEPAFSYVYENGRRYGLIGSAPCVTVKNTAGNKG